MGRLLTALFALVLVLAACGGDEDGPGNASTEITIEMSDFAFEPEQVAVPAGEEITVTLNNVGSVDHNWIIVNSGIQIESESEIPDDRSDFELVSSDIVEAGASTTFTFTAPGRGVYQVICDVPGHFTAGMEGRFGVEEG
jgi:uncharacterized cupredoxin-like copper-binding protein